MTITPNARNILAKGANLFTAAELEKKQIHDERAMSRRTDPATSKAAARRANRSGALRGQYLAIARALLAVPVGEDATAVEIVRIVNERGLVDGAYDQHRACRRIPELVARGVVVVTRERECSERGETMRAYALGAAQRSAMEEGSGGGE